MSETEDQEPAGTTSTKVAEGTAPEEHEPADALPEPVDPPAEPLTTEPTTDQLLLHEASVDQAALIEASPTATSNAEISLAPPVEPELPPPPLAFLVIIAGISLVADLGTKFWAKDTLSGPDRHARAAKHFHLINQHVDLIFAQNPGGAWSFLRSLPDSLRRPFFLVVSASAIVFIISIYGKVRPEQWAMKWGLPLALGGALGNLVDRIRYGWVVDFVDVYVNKDGGEHHWPTFNVADIAIVFGVGLMAFEMMRPRKDDTPTKAEPAPSGQP